MDETLEQCTSIILIPKASGKIRLDLDPAWHNKLLLRYVHRGPTLNGVLLRLAGIKYLTFIDASNDYHNLKLDKRSL